MICAQTECMNRTTGCEGYGECQAARFQRDKQSFVVGLGGRVTFSCGLPPMVQQGWECPRCKTIHAPFMPTCMNCKPPKIDYTQGAGDPGKTGGAS